MVAIAPSSAAAPDMRVPPQSVEAEQHVIGGLLLAPQAIDQIDFLEARHFYAEAHRLAFACIRTMVEAGRPVDTMLLADALQARGELEAVGGQAYLGSLAVNIPSAANIRRYAEIVRDRAKLRELQAVALETYEKAAAPGADAGALQDEAEARIFAMRTSSDGGEMGTLEDALMRAVERVDQAYSGDGKICGIETGLIDLDRMTGGFEPGDLVVIGARPSVGKTALALGIGEHVARHAGPVALFSMEMSALQIGMRQMAGSAQVSMHELRTGRLSEDDWPKIMDAIGRLRDLPFFIDDRPAATIGHIRARCRRLYRKKGALSLVVVDYLTLMAGKGDTRDERVGGLAKGLKEIAKEFNAPVIALAQLNRNLELRADKHPLMADLRESGEIEQAADVIILLHREDAYVADSPMKGIAELMVAKQRNGPTGTVYATFLERTMRFVNFAGELPQRRTPRPRITAPAGFDYKSAQAGDRKEAA